MLSNDGRGIHATKPDTGPFWSEKKFWRAFDNNLWNHSQLVHILPLFLQIKDMIAILTPFYSHFLLIWDTSEFCRESRANPPHRTLVPPHGGRVPRMPKSLLITLPVSKLFSKSPQLQLSITLIFKMMGLMFNWSAWSETNFRVQSLCKRPLRLWVCTRSSCDFKILCMYTSWCL